MRVIGRRVWYSYSDIQHYEPRHDRTNKMSVRPTKTQISLGIFSKHGRPTFFYSGFSYELLKSCQHRDGYDGNDEGDTC